jgi:hypothetical protein
MCLKANHYEDTGILRIKVADRIIIWVTYTSLILLQLLKMASWVIYAQCGPLWKQSHGLHMTGFIVAHVCESIHYAIQQLSPSAWLHCTHQGLPISPKTVAQKSQVKWPWGPSNQTLLPNPTVLKILTEKCNYLPFKMRDCVTLLQPQVLFDMDRNI